jgi:uncharacterized protein (DUF2252 family)
MITFGSTILAPMLSIDPVRLARRQLDVDRERTERFDHLLAHKIGRMTVSPLSFLRGSATLFYDLLDRHPELAAGPPGSGWLVGDAHLENFGAYRPDTLSLDKPSRTAESDTTVVFDLNDFDEAVEGPWHLDLLRLVTSLVLGGREVGADGPRTLELCHALIDAYAGAAFQQKRSVAAAPVVTALVERVRRRSRKQLLDARTNIVQGERRFVRGKRYREVAAATRRKAERAFARYTRRLPDAERPAERALEVIDVAFRVAGTGSLGCTRLAILVRGKGGVDGAWIFDMKEQGIPAAAGLVRPPPLEPAERVCTAVRACVARPPRMMGRTRMRGSSMFVRRLTPQEDKLDLVTLRQEDLMPLARHLGALLGAAHRRGARRPPKKLWSDDERQRLLAKAIALAGTHEAAYLAYCELVRG